MAASEIVLHQWEISPFCGKVRKLLALKRLLYRTVDYNGLRALRAARLSPVGKLPVIDYDGERIQDSTAIAEFLERKHPEPSIYPEDVVARQLAHVFEDWADEALHWFEVYFRFSYPDAVDKTTTLLCADRPGFEKPVVALVAQRQYRSKLRAQGLGRTTREDVEGRFDKHLKALEAILQERQWLVGNQRSIADIAVSAQLDEIVRTSHMADQVRAHSALREWLERNDPPPAIAA